MLFDQTADRKVRVFSLNPGFLTQFAGKQPNWGYGGLGQFTYKRTYARPTCDCHDASCPHPTEEYWQTVRRVVEGVYNIQKIHCRNLSLPWNEPKAQRSAQDMFMRMWQFKFTPPGRGLWMMGTDQVLEKGSASLQNCAFCSTENIAEDFAGPFTFLMDMSMLGVGVGGDTRGAGKVRIILPKRTSEPFVVEDSREGWVELIRTVLNSFVGKGAYPTFVDFSKVRPRGDAIKGFGGVASGPGPLAALQEGITRLLLPQGATAHMKTKEDDNGKIILCQTTFRNVKKAQNYRIGSTQIVDVFNYIGKCVVAGGVRRTAEIMFGNPDDAEFMALKQDPEALEDRRWASNNSVFGRVGMDYTEVAKAAAVNGEPGIFWLENSRGFGRMGDPRNNKDHRVMGCNPCVTGDTLVFTVNGPQRIDKLLDEDFYVLVDGKNYKSSPAFVTGTKPVYLVQTSEGHSIKVTADHQILTSPRTTQKKRYEMWTAAEDLVPGDSIILNDSGGGLDGGRYHGWEGTGTEDVGWLLGNLLGDGHFHADGYAALQFWGDTRTAMLEKALPRIEQLGGDERYHGRRTGSDNEDRQMTTVKTTKLVGVAREFGITERKEIINDHVLRASSDFHSGFLRGLFDADGSVQGSQEKGVSVRLASSTRRHLLVAQQMLLHLGINSTIYWNRREPGIKAMPDGRGGSKDYECKSQHELVVAKSNLQTFSDRVGFEEPVRRDALRDCLQRYTRSLNRERFVATVEGVSFVGVETVYDCTVDEVHRFGANGIQVHNCGEQPLEDRELCNLVETYPAHHDSYEDYERTLKMAYLYAKSVTLIPTHDPRANAVMMRNRRIGCSMSGIVQAMVKLGRRGFLTWCDQGYKYITQLDRIYSEWLCIPRSIKTTTVKPSGTVSLLTGATPGIHYPHSQHYIRNVRVSNTSPLVQAARVAGYEVQEDPYADDTSVVGFPVQEKHYDKGKNDVTVWEQFCNAADLQRHWADNQVSVTVTFDPERPGELKSALECFEDKLKAVSMLPFDPKSSGYKLPPYDAISEEAFQQRMARITPLALDASQHEVTERFCDGDKCVI